MPEHHFPADDYTPHGYLHNPYDAGPFHGLDAGGPLRSVEPCGFGWTGGGSLQVAVRVGEDLFLTVEDFWARGVELVSRYHTSRAQDFVWEWRGARVEVTFVLAGRDGLACRLRAVGRPVPLSAYALASCPRKPRSWDGSRAFREEAAALCVYADPGPWYAVTAGCAPDAQGFFEDTLSAEALTGALAAKEQPLGVSRASGAERLYAVALYDLPPAAEQEQWIGLARGVTALEAAEAALEARGRGKEALEGALEEDDLFWSRAPRLEGDWPASWRRSWVYDLESTRMMVQSPAGVFTRRWPTWTVPHQRAVLAEGTLDMLRHGWADPQAAREAVATLLRETPGDQVPCCWANGGYNMVAGDGSPCGTSPAWCLPFHNILRLYLLDPNREWLSAVYPEMARYLRWWLAHRTDAEGWAVYKCTWESGEDCTPRLDPEQTGFRDLTRVARPGELQAALAMSARVLAVAARELDRPEAEVEEWEGVFRRYRELTHRLWDPERGHFRDLWPATGGFVEAKGEYWGASDVTHDALHLIPLLYDIAAPEQRETLAGHLASFNALPWKIWPSWTYVVTEACRAVGRHAEAGRMSCDVLARVYEENDRRDLSRWPRPLPGVTREYWPLSLDDYGASEIYGWGATTSLLLLRHVVGFSESEHPRGLRFHLAPWLPDDWMRPDAVFRLTNLHYRGCRLDLELRPIDSEDLEVRVALDPDSVLEVEDPASAAAFPREGRWFRLRMPRGRSCALRAGSASSL